MNPKPLKPNFFLAKLTTFCSGFSQCLGGVVQLAWFPNRMIDVLPRCHRFKNDVWESSTTVHCCRQTFSRKKVEKRRLSDKPPKQVRWVLILTPGGRVFEGRLNPHGVIRGKRSHSREESAQEEAQATNLHPRWLLDKYQSFFKASTCRFLYIVFFWPGDTCFTLFW